MILVGVGNPWRGDDAAGLVVARRLGGLALEGDGSRLLDCLARADSVIVVDASSSGAEPGTVRHFDAGAGPLPAGTLRSSTHAFGVAEAIELARALGRLPAACDVYAIEGGDFSLGSPLSPPVCSAVERLATAIAGGAVARADVACTSSMGPGAS